MPFSFQTSKAQILFTADKRVHTSVMDVAIAFVLGILTSIISSYIFLWLTERIPLERQRLLLRYVRRPRLSLRLLRKSEERRAADTIRRLFAGWCAKDLALYLSCWSDDCVRVKGVGTATKDDKDAIRNKFL